MRNNLIILILVHIWIVGCVSNTAKQQADNLNQLSELKDSKYLGGFNKDQLALAAHIEADIRDDFAVLKCKEVNPMQGQKVGSVEKLTKPENVVIEHDGVRMLITNLESNRRFVKDLSLYILGNLGPSIKEVLPWLEYYKDQDKYFSSWVNYALENIGCDKWSNPNYVLPYHDAVIPNEEDFNLIIHDMFVNKTLYPPGVYSDFISNYLSDIENSDYNPIKFIEFIKDPDLSPDIKAEIVAALSDVDFSEHEVYLDQFIPFLTDNNEYLVEELEYVFLENKHPYGLKIIKSYIQQNDYSYIEFLCLYGKEASSFENRLLEIYSDLNGMMDERNFIETIGCIGSEKSVPMLIELLSNPNWELQIEAIKALKTVANENTHVKQALKELYEESWSLVVRNYIIDRNPYITPECLADEYYGCPIYEGPLAIDLSRLPINHGMTVCKNNAWFSYDEVNWFKVNWQGSDNTTIPDGFPENLLSDHFEHTLLETGEGWLFGSDHGHYSGSLYFWNETEKSGYYLGLGAEVFKILKHNDMVLGLGYSYETSVSGQIFNLSVNEEGFWVADHKLTLPSAPYLYGYDPDGELLIADDLNQYSVRNNKITPLNCKIE